MNLSFPSNDPFDGTIVNSANDAPVYQTKTHNLLRRVTLLTKFVPDLGEFQPVADLHWEEVSSVSPYVVYKGQKIVISDFLRRKGFFSRYVFCVYFFSLVSIEVPNHAVRAKIFDATNNRQYEWKSNFSDNLVVSGDSFVL